MQRLVRAYSLILADNCGSYKNKTCMVVGFVMSHQGRPHVPYLGLARYDKLYWAFGGVAGGLGRRAWERSKDVLMFSELLMR